MPPGNRMTRRDKEQRIYALSTVSGVAGVGFVVLTLLSIIGIIGFGPAIVCLIVAVVAGFMARSTVGR